jgi:hypothetical protein
MPVLFMAPTQRRKLLKYKEKCRGVMTAACIHATFVREEMCEWNQHYGEMCWLAANLIVEVCANAGERRLGKQLYASLPVSPVVTAAQSGTNFLRRYRRCR